MSGVLASSVITIKEHLSHVTIILQVITVLGESPFWQIYELLLAQQNYTVVIDASHLAAIYAWYRTDFLKFSTYDNKYLQMGHASLTTEL